MYMFSCSGSCHEKISKSCQCFDNLTKIVLPLIIKCDSYINIVLPNKHFFLWVAAKLLIMLNVSLCFIIHSLLHHVYNKVSFYQWFSLTYSLSYPKSRDHGSWGPKFHDFSWFIVCYKLPKNQKKKFFTVFFSDLEYAGILCSPALKLHWKAPHY